MDFAKVLAELARFLEHEKARFGVAGALALHAHGLTRATADVDLVVDERVQQSLLRFLALLGYERLHVSAGFSNHLHPQAAWGRVDVIYVDEATGDLLFGQAKPAVLFPGVTLLVPRAEHLAAMKVRAMKNDPSRTFQDLADLQFLLGLPDVDEAEIRGYFDKHGLLERFDELKRAIDAARS